MRSVRDFLRNCRANTAMVTALVMIPLSVVIGTGVDVRRAQNVKTEIQNAVDAAILTASRELFKGASEADAIAKAKQVFAENADTLGVTSDCDVPEVQVDLAVREVTGSVGCDLPLTFAAIMGRDTLRVSVEAGSAYGGTEIELALMLDASGSMSGQKLIDLQEASRDLIDTLIPVSGSGEVRISLVPYATSLNAGVYGDVVTGITGLYAHTVANLGADHDKLVAALANGGSSEAFDLYTATGNGGLGSLPTEFFQCTGGWPDNLIYCDDWDHGECEDWDYGTPHSSPARICTNYDWDEDDDEDACSSWHWQDEPSCLNGSGSPVDTASEWQALDWSSASAAYADFDFSVLGAEHAANIGLVSCVTEREGAHAFTNVSPIPNHVGARSSSCPRAAVEPLTDNKTILKNAIDDLTANGWTAGHLGIAWSWYTLSESWAPVWPFNRRAKPADPASLRKIAVLMTDGSFNTHYASGQGNSVAQARSLCDAMKADGIEIYAVAFDAPSAGEAVLSYCASSPHTFYTADDGDELQAAYAEIAMEISQIRLTR